MKLTQTHLDNAIHFAASAHNGQFDKGGNPYILHPMQLMHWARKDGESIDVQILCLLHDVVEDCYEDPLDGLSEIAEFFGDDMMRLVDNLTKREGEKYEAYLSRVGSDIRSVKVKRYDLRHNSDLRRLKGVTQKDTERAVKYMTAYYNFGEQWGLK
ncbi:hypothetical protein OFDDKENP_00254 [Aeromonas phage B614]|nr:hypothetical protein OFDDKENP_00254 [Aeromonas phage B614]UYD58269.1 hypothetical protein JNEOFJEA_00190 [Aeromonas phage UP87]UYD58383.1 hypothetical protein IPAKJDPM_00040 [Aeromonas phage avDM14-QBC]UYD58599.1 hypothetical protein HNNIDBEH_00006 [Aeromonas phage avDM10-HWA]UYD59098.1 hypothetical protein OFOPOMKI_00248 [Aeromonas phage avDM7-IJDJ]UYD59910.1 hypothetical protein LEHPIFIF_00137 [Aeromonas phage avDM9-HANS]